MYCWKKQRNKHTNEIKATILSRMLVPRSSMKDLLSNTYKLLSNIIMLFFKQMRLCLSELGSSFINNFYFGIGFMIGLVSNCGWFKLIWSIIYYSYFIEIKLVDSINLAYLCPVILWKPGNFLNNKWGMAFNFIL